LTHAPASQYACVAAGWSAQTQALEIDVKAAESVEEVMRLAAPCVSESPAYVPPHLPPLHFCNILRSYPCAAGINTSSVLVFTDIASLDLLVTQASAGAIRALPLGLFAALVTQDSFTQSTVSTSDDLSKSDAASAYHSHVSSVFTDPSIQLPVLTWPDPISTAGQHASWLVNAAVDAWLKHASWHFLRHAHAVVAARTAASFLPNVTSPIGANGRQCTLASLHLDRAQHYLSTHDTPQFLAGAWFFIDLASVCMFSVLNLQLLHPASARIEEQFVVMYWKLMQLDRQPLPEMAGCDPCVARASCLVPHFGSLKREQVRCQGRAAPH
jgi:hypothetical protein